MAKVTPMMFKAFWHRLVDRYVFADFHPLVIFYIFGGACLSLGTLSSCYLVFDKILLSGEGVTAPRAVLSTLFILSGVMSVLAAMSMDIQNFQYQKLQEAMLKKNHISNA